MIDIGKMLRRRIYFIEIRKKIVFIVGKSKSIPCEEIYNYDGQEISLKKKFVH